MIDIDMIQETPRKALAVKTAFIRKIVSDRVNENNKLTMNRVVPHGGHFSTHEGLHNRHPADLCFDTSNLEVSVDKKNYQT